MKIKKTLKCCGNQFSNSTFSTTAECNMAFSTKAKCKGCLAPQTFMLKT